MLLLSVPLPDRIGPGDKACPPLSSGFEERRSLLKRSNHRIEAEQPPGKAPSLTRFISPAMIPVMADVVERTDTILRNAPMKIFISWSGDRSKALAQAFKEWLPLVLHYVEPWHSDADIDAGERWAQSVAKELAASNFGIICVTSENITSPWILFEAGALTKSLETGRVIPLLLDLEFTDISGSSPLAQFQAKKLTRQGVQEIINSIQQAAEKPVLEARATELFDALWTALESKLEAIPKEAPDEREVRPTTEVLEDLVASVRALDSRMRELEEMGGGHRRRSKRLRGRMHPMMMHEFAHMVGDGPGDPLGILVVASMFRDELPWMYELASDAYRAIREKRSDASQAIRRFRRAIEMVAHGRFPLEEFGLDPEMVMMAVHDLERYSGRFEDPEEGELDEERDEKD